MSDIPLSIRSAVIDRAGDRCEYCQLSQAGQEAAFHIDHVWPRAVGGLTNIENLALACVSCSLRKGARISAVDPVMYIETSLFNPRRDSWREHFRWNDERVVGFTPTGRATVEALAMNRSLIRSIRLEEMLRGRHPPV